MVKNALIIMSVVAFGLSLNSGVEAGKKEEIEDAQSQLSPKKLGTGVKIENEKRIKTDRRFQDRLLMGKVAKKLEYPPEK